MFIVLSMFLFLNKKKDVSLYPFFLFFFNFSFVCVFLVNIDCLIGFACQTKDLIFHGYQTLTSTTNLLQKMFQLLTKKKKKNPNVWNNIFYFNKTFHGKYVPLQYFYFSIHFYVTCYGIKSIAFAIIIIVVAFSFFL